MITIPQPAMVLNAENVPGPDYKMWNTRKVTKDTDPKWLMINVASVARSATNGKLLALVINCHGKAKGDNGGYGLSLGTGIKRGNVEPLFSTLKGLVDDIWLVACQAARISEPGGDGDGNLFCGAMAKAAGANVYASTADQTTGLWPYIPFGKIDGYEGKVYKYKSDGSCELTNY
ncbi:hypothetical protein D3874_20450 [Oleomonas cavernae]|uniref:DUF4347 domain-containing protein n=1 Tax=Oleomonas cavernae TaxID=2320859 RepID=A0A418WGB1_9PROT|nr:hypothetical protein [Oleomonas cavernae]RJF89053.1 hypothetical protein D3874_20450 [Oleomonas cavernae]